MLSTTGSLAATLGTIQPFRYRGYVYDVETGLYYLRARYYNPIWQRFVNADTVIEGLATSPHGYNQFCYCYNNIINRIDITGNDSVGICSRLRKLVQLICKAIVSACVIKYDVPLYSQGNYSLCWAFCEVMVEDAKNGTQRTQEEAEARAIELAKIYHKSETDWNAGGWPTGFDKDNILQSFHSVSSIADLYVSLVNNGPVYGYYVSNDGKDAHLIVVTGVEVANNLIYSNNPWGYQGKQTFDEFQQGFIGMPDNWDWALYSLLY